MEDEYNVFGVLSKKSKILVFILVLFFGVIIIVSILYKNSLQKPYEPYHRNEILSWEFKGVVKSISSPGHNIVTVVINDKQYELYDYNTSSSLSSDEHLADSTSDFGYNSRILKGDSLIKSKGQFEIKLIKYRDGKQFVFNCSAYQ
jgi:hypothetical protein